MDHEIEFAQKLEAIDARCKSNTHRIGELKEEITAVNQLATSVAVMAEQLKAMNANVDSLSDKVDAIEAKPAKRWEGLVDKLLFAVAGAVLAWLVQGGPGL